MAAANSAGSSRRPKRSPSAAAPAGISPCSSWRQRGLGFAARFVTGYLCDPASIETAEETLSGGGATHAWADVFVPGAGWVEFDPTNALSRAET